MTSPMPHRIVASCDPAKWRVLPPSPAELEDHDTIRAPQLPEANLGSRAFESRRTRTVVAACGRGSAVEGLIQAGWLAASRRSAPRANGIGFRRYLSRCAG